MVIGKIRNSISLNDILSKVTEGDILAFYLGITKIPALINSPLRNDNKPSFGIYSTNGVKIQYTDFSTKESGGLFDLLKKMWNCDFEDVLDRINNDLCKFVSTDININKSAKIPTCKIYKQNSSNQLRVKVRDWEAYDIEYWKSYGISLQWLKYAEVYPISHKIIIKEGKRFVFKADKYAYAYVEHKENNVTLKIYQPFNKAGYKWNNKHDKSVLSLWTKVPEYGNRICICASLKDALCLSANTGIPAISTQGEGYGISDTAISELRRRYKEIYILFDNDEAGLKDGLSLSESTGFTNIILPKIEELGNPKDISDLYKALQNPDRFKKIILDLFK